MVGVEGRGNEEESTRGETTGIGGGGQGGREGGRGDYSFESDRSSTSLKIKGRQIKGILRYLPQTDKNRAVVRW